MIWVKNITVLLWDILSSEYLNFKIAVNFSSFNYVLNNLELLQSGSPASGAGVGIKFVGERGKSEPVFKYNFSKSMH